jgi:hypothetical protein
MTLGEQIVEKLRDLPPEKQKVVLEFVESLRKQNGAPRSLRGLWSNLNFRVTEREIAEARREMWGKFPREIP